MCKKKTIHLLTNIILLYHFTSMKLCLRPLKYHTNKHNTHECIKIKISVVIDISELYKKLKVEYTFGSLFIFSILFGTRYELPLVTRASLHLTTSLANSNWTVLWVRFAFCLQSRLIMSLLSASTDVSVTITVS